MVSPQQPKGMVKDVVVRKYAQLLECTCMYRNISRHLRVCHESQHLSMDDVSTTIPGRLWSVSKTCRIWAADIVGFLIGNHHSDSAVYTDSPDAHHSVGLRIRRSMLYEDGKVGKSEKSRAAVQVGEDSSPMRSSGAQEFGSIMRRGG